MVILAGLLALGSRFATRILTTALGWASTLLFGRVPAERQRLLLGVAFGSIIWLVLVAGIFLPGVGTFLLVLLPAQDVVPDSVLRLGMLIGALLAPAVVGLLVVALGRGGRQGGRRTAAAIAKGYPLTVVLAVLLLFLAGLAVWRRLVSLKRGWTDAHVPFVVKPGAYDRVAEDLERAIDAAGLDVSARPAPASMSRPANWLGRVAGAGAAALVPDHMVRLVGPDLDILIYPMDAMISGRPATVTRARAAIASRLTTAAANLTVSSEAQGVEDRITRLAGGDIEGSRTFPTYDLEAQETLADIDATLTRIQIPYDEWETLYRQRLQVERDLRARFMAGLDDLGEPGSSTKPGRSVGNAIRNGAGLIVDVVTDDRTVVALDRLAGPGWRLGLQAGAAAAAVAMRIAARTIRRIEAGAGEAQIGRAPESPQSPNGQSGPPAPEGTPS